MKNSELKHVIDANDAFKSTLESVMTNGSEIKAEESKSIGSGKSFKEIINYNLVIENPQKRILRSSKRPINLPGAIARFVWMMAANNRLADIEFYWGAAVTPFSDDGYTVPGSSYGARMFNSSPGLDQIEAIINRLRKDPSTRRAAVAIYHPVDAIRDSKDIPCTFGLFYHVREKKLVSTVVMRSNNAFILLPYNIFEFSLLAEVIAKEVRVSLGHMNYNALSMHVYKEHYEKAYEVIMESNIEDDLVFPDMPMDPNPLSEVKKLIMLESKIRHISAGLNNSNINEWLKPSIMIDKNEIRLHDYWRQFYYLLLYHIVLKKTSDKEALKKVAELIDEPYKKYLSADDLKITQNNTVHDLFGYQTGNQDYFAYNQYAQKLNSLEMLCDEFNNNANNKNTGKTINLANYVTLRERLVGDVSDIKKIAARGDNPEISKDDFLNSVAELLND